jgi:hypothetical protein
MSPTPEFSSSREPSSAEIFGDIVMSAELRLLDALERQDTDPRFVWVTYQNDPASGKDVVWYRLSERQDTDLRWQQSFDVGMTVTDRRDKQIMTVDEGFLLIRQKTAQGETVTRLDDHTAKDFTDRDLPIPALVDKLNRYFPQPIRIRYQPR